MTQADPETSLAVERTFNAPREHVFRAWTTREELLKWFSPLGFTTPEADVDLRTGGTYRLVMRSPDGDDLPVTGTFQEITPPDRLVYTWRWDVPGADNTESLVTIEFQDVGGKTRVVLTHTRLPSVEEVKKHEEGWIGCLQSLEAHLTGTTGEG